MKGPAEAVVLKFGNSLPDFLVAQIDVIVRQVRNDAKETMLRSRPSDKNERIAEAGKLPLIQPLRLNHLFRLIAEPNRYWSILVFSQYGFDHVCPLSRPVEQPRSGQPHAGEETVQDINDLRPICSG